METSSLKEKYESLRKSFELCRYFLTVASVPLFFLLIKIDFEFLIFGPVALFILSGIVLDIIFLDLFGVYQQATIEKNFQEI